MTSSTMNGTFNPYLAETDFFPDGNRTSSQEWLMNLFPELPQPAEIGLPNNYSGFENFQSSTNSFQEQSKIVPPNPLESSSIDQSMTYSISNDGPPALRTRSSTSAAVKRRMSSRISKPTPSSSITRKLSKNSKVDLHSDEKIEVIPRRFFPPSGNRKQHRSGFRQVPGPDGVVKKGRPSKKEYQQGGVQIDMYHHKKIILPENKDAPVVKKQTSRSASIKKSKADHTSSPSVSGSQSQDAQAQVPSEVQTNDLSGWPTIHDLEPSLSFSNVSQPSYQGWNGGTSALHDMSYLNHPTSGSHFQPTGPYGQQDPSHLSVPYSTPHGSNTSLPMMDPLSHAIQPDLASYSINNGSVTLSNQASSIGHYSGLDSVSMGFSPGNSSMGGFEYGSLPMSYQNSYQNSSIGEPDPMMNLSNQPAPANFLQYQMPPLDQYGNLVGFDTHHNNHNHNHNNNNNHNTSYVDPFSQFSFQQ
ncbi:hypothetical protein DFH28DRAFT_1105145 [Melampsora americana]|nr:hypothetical protein DFH28DRAFT_1105145 [Melampsora americana]